MAPASTLTGCGPSAAKRGSTSSRRTTAAFGSFRRPAGKGSTTASAASGFAERQGTSMSSIHLHLRTLPLDFRPVVPFNALIAACENVFRPVKVSIKIESDETLRLPTDEDKARFAVLRVHNSCAGESVTAEQKALFELVAREKIATNDVV